MTVVILLLCAEFIAALGCGLAAGVFFAGSSFVMQGLRDLPAADGIVFLTDPNDIESELEARDVQSAAQAVRQQITILKAANVSDLDAVFAGLVQPRTKRFLLAPMCSLSPSVINWRCWRPATRYRSSIRGVCLSLRAAWPATEQVYPRRTGKSDSTPAPQG